MAVFILFVITAKVRAQLKRIQSEYSLRNEIIHSTLRLGAEAVVKNLHNFTIFNEVALDT